MLSVNSPTIICIYDSKSPGLVGRWTDPNCDLIWSECYMSHVEQLDRWAIYLKLFGNDQSKQKLVAVHL